MVGDYRGVVRVDGGVTPAGVDVTRRGAVRLGMCGRNQAGLAVQKMVVIRFAKQYPMPMVEQRMHKVTALMIGSVLLRLASIKVSAMQMANTFGIRPRICVRGLNAMVHGE